MMETITENKLDELFQSKKDILSIYFTAGYPRLEDTPRILLALQDAGADLVEVGIPFSDPVADGPIIQNSSQQALSNGVSLGIIFDQLQAVQGQIEIPLVMMGYFNPILQYGISRFCKSCASAGISAAIIPDLPLEEYLLHYQYEFQANGQYYVPLISPQTSSERMQMIDSNAEGFIYLVASSSITGKRGEVSADQERYFERVQRLDITSPKLIGFGISNNTTFNKACQYANGAIIGSAFVEMLAGSSNIEEDINKFITEIKRMDHDH